MKTAKLQVPLERAHRRHTQAGRRWSWTGSGWTGQPLIVKWPDDLKQIMNIKEAKKTDPGLTEIIYPCLDGKIYFLDLKDGTYTGPSIVSGGGPFKGTGSLYPERHPHPVRRPRRRLARASNRPERRLYSLIDQKLLYTFGAKPDPSSHRSLVTPTTRARSSTPARTPSSSRARTASSTPSS